MKGYEYFYSVLEYKVYMCFKEIVYCIIYLLLTLVGMTMIKIGSQSTDHQLFKIVNVLISPKMVMGIICYGCSFLMYIFIISQMQISLMLPILSALNSVSIVIIGLTVFKETLVPGQLIGIAIIIFGTSVIVFFSKS